MKILKWIGIIIAILFVVFLVFTGTQPSVLKVEKSATINSSPDQIFKVISDFTTWTKWSAWHKMDTAMVMEYEGEMNQIGAKSSWTSLNPMVGNGSQEIIELEENKFFKSEMHFGEEPAANYAWFTLEENEDNSVTLTWNMEGAETGFFMNWQNTVFKPMIEESYEKSLKDLKELVESMPIEIANPMNLEVTEVEPISIISIKDSTDAAGISAKLGELYGELSIFMAMNDGISEAGLPLTLYHYYSEEKVVLEAALPYSGEAEPEGRISISETPSGKVIKGIYKGTDNNTEDMHYAIEDFGKASSLEFVGPCWEIYQTANESAENALVETHIYYPVQ